MKFVLIYNPENEIERDNLQTLVDALGDKLFCTYDFRTVRDLFPVWKTPALIPIREDLQGEELLSGDINLKISAEIAKLQEDEELKVHQQETYRLDNFVNAEKQKAVAEEYQKLIAAEKISIEDVLGTISEKIALK